MTKKKKKVLRKFKTRMLLFVPVCLSLIVVLVVTIGKYWVDIISKYKENELLSRELVELREKEAELRVDVEKLQDPEYLERYAREKYLFTKDGEIVLKFPDE